MCGDIYTFRALSQSYDLVHTLFYISFSYAAQSRTQIQIYVNRMTKHIYDFSIIARNPYGVGGWFIRRANYTADPLLNMNIWM